MGDILNRICKLNILLIQVRINPQLEKIQSCEAPEEGSLVMFNFLDMPFFLVICIDDENGVNGRIS